jgi:hypothetical protein
MRPSLMRPSRMRLKSLTMSMNSSMSRWTAARLKRRWKPVSVSSLLYNFSSSGGK